MGLLQEPGEAFCNYLDAYPRTQRFFLGADGFWPHSLDCSTRNRHFQGHTHKAFVNSKEMVSEHREKSWECADLG